MVSHYCGQFGLPRENGEGGHPHHHPRSIPEKSRLSPPTPAAARRGDTFLPAPAPAATQRQGMVNQNRRGVEPPGERGSCGNQGCNTWGRGCKMMSCRVGAWKGGRGVQWEEGVVGWEMVGGRDEWVNGGPTTELVALWGTATQLPPCGGWVRSSLKLTERRIQGVTTELEGCGEGSLSACAQLPEPGY